VDERAVNELRRLATLDAELAESASTLRELDGTVATIRRRTEAIDAFFAAYPEAEAHRGARIKAAAMQELGLETWLCGQVSGA